MTYLQVILNGIFLGGFYLLMAQGLNLIFGIMGIVNLAHGAFMVLGGLGVYSLYNVGVNPFLGLVVVMIAAAVVGAAVQWLIIERISVTGRQGELLTLMATFGLSYILINLGQRGWGSDFKTIPYLQSSLKVGALRFPASLLIGVVLAALLTLAISVWLHRTRTGMSLLATAQSPLGAGACGINPRRLRLIGFGMGAALAAAAGMLLVLTQPIAPQMATHFTIVAFVVVALGGLGNYSGAAVGAVLVGILQTLSGYQFGAVIQEAAPYLILILVMLFLPNGLLTRKAAPA
ncbi:branched-chain amino acid ABC transporter permease [Rhodococcus sp. T7]|uniref:branched-chain amino acid ABC transporter permease n=1 Tax=Rhodococcus sp. T7 TaxID=627444 RepID=UPI00135AFD8B|nr:branched-chain amino acid ABC transporter permease [Rhodococcus sp. T7]KAF0957813.1 High-affinity branched-chain amino acid transport system permease protein LivH [Rhodococcus sp. T7]KAF0961534.1 High-affinity branched-chain amino acid transport system permease protein LivH [Rhodococcus sp. T7]